MELKIEVKRIDWWFWAITLIFIVLALAGWSFAYSMVMVISCVQVVYFAWHEGSLTAFATQVRIVYFAFTLFGLWPGVRWYIYVLLFIGTFMVTLYDRCVIALVLKKMPWNRDLVNPQCKLP